MDNKNEKKHFRKKYKNIISKIPNVHHMNVSNFLSEYIYHNLPKNGLIASFIKIPSQNEIDLSWINLKLSTNNRLALPKVGLKGLEFYQVNRMEFLSSRPPYNIPEPNSVYYRRIKLKELSLILVPGLAFDLNGYRIGRGGGYYDKFLSEIRKMEQNIKTIGVGFREQLINRRENIPIDDWDIPVDELVLL